MMYLIVNIAFIIVGIIYWYRSYKHLLELNRDSSIFNKYGLLVGITMLLSIAVMMIGTIDLLGR